jgi:4-amino-4-deoxy-L-arabinose transferase-like glycosyltransferase
LFRLAGVGMGQARLVSISAVALTMMSLGWGLRRPLGGGAALLASLAYGTSALVLFYGRLAFLEPMVALGLTVGGLLALRAHDRRSGRWGLVAGAALAMAIATKPSAAFAAAGIVAGLAAVGWRSPHVRRWLGGAVAAVVGAGVTWAVLIGLPNHDAVVTDLRIWAAEPILASLPTMIRQVITFPIRNDRFLVLAAPLLLFGGFGLTVARRSRRTLSRDSLVLLAAVTGWLIVGLGILALAPYRPNRYELPMLPALAILGGIGWSLLAPRLGSMPRVRSTSIGVALAAAIVVPGLLQFGGWMADARSSLPVIEADVRAIVPQGATVQGDYAPAFALQAAVVTLVSRPPTRVNAGDLYVSRDVRWYVGAVGTAPAWAVLHPLAWASRTQRLCALWGGHNVCLWHLP